MLHGGPRGYIEATYATWAEEAAALRAYVQQSVDEIRAHHARYQSSVDQRTTADQQVLEAIAAFTEIANSTDITAIHKQLADALETDIWGQLCVHSENEAKTLAAIGARIEKSVQLTVQRLHDANAGKPSLPPRRTGHSTKQRLLFRIHHFYISLVRICADARHIAITFAAVSMGLAGVAHLIEEIARISTGS
ncbi:hypothetical protein C7401_15440 [Paraburkholderia unamae]|uniref:hypothetical protein n=1 Tax=Paraburkholderia unamae TaxID=219649 RepID=UPI000DC4B1F0|nr:hypothetical protein [Paraburkholderia unamae]RAR47999.1 hypothetical protein C7401_15440 [Paraburkholderia unamae]